MGQRNMALPASFKDLFSLHSADYARYRPDYPDALFQYLSSLVVEHQHAWDVATGNGQAACQLARYFQSVVGTDLSAQQISKAQKNPKVRYQLGIAEKADFPNQSMNLITVAQAFHWFKADLFFSEAYRVLKPQGILAFWCYELAKVTPEFDGLVMRFYNDVLGPYWEPERRLVDLGYRTIQLPHHDPSFQEIVPPPFEMEADWSFEHWAGYVSTWSAFQTFLQKTGLNPMEPQIPEFKAAWGSAQTRTLRWRVGLRVGRKV